VLHAVVRDTPLSWADYRRLAEEDGEPPDGLLIRLAGRTAEGVRVIEVWSSPTALEHYEASGARDRRPDELLGRPTVRNLLVEHVVRAPQGFPD
jgi:hypothetical protein